MHDRPEASFSATLTPLSRHGVHHLRVVTQSGRIYRSRPLALPMTEDGGTARVTVFSETTGAPVAVDVAATRVPTIAYAFTPAHGSALVTPESRDWQAEAGGGFAYKGPFNRSLPPALDLPGPTWTEKDGTPCLAFNGQNHYLWFPNDVVPTQAGFRVNLEIWPATTRRQILLRTEDAFTLEAGNDGMLTLNAILRGRDARRLESGVALPTGRWSRLELSYEPGQGFRLSVDGQTSELLACETPLAALYAQTLFGGYGSVPAVYFEGWLRAFRVVHRP